MSGPSRLGLEGELFAANAAKLAAAESYRLATSPAERQEDEAAYLHHRDRETRARRALDLFLGSVTP